MCGIFGYVAKSPKARVDVDIFKKIAKDCSSRGTHSFGVSQIVSGGLWTYKQPGSVSMYIDKLDWIAGATAVIGHTRHSTSGHWSNNSNNQPIAFGSPKTPVPFAVAHNGSFDNYSELKEHLSLETDCDSEIIGSSICRTISEKVGFSGALLSSANLMTRNKMQAPFAILMINKDRVYAVRNSNPLHIWDEGDGVYFSSITITNAEAPGRNPDSRQIPEGKVWCWSVKGDSRSPDSIKASTPSQPSKEEVVAMVCLENNSSVKYTKPSKVFVDKFVRLRGRRSIMTKVYKSVSESAYFSSGKDEEDNKSIRLAIVSEINRYGKGDQDWMSALSCAYKRYPTEFVAVDDTGPEETKIT